MNLNQPKSPLQNAQPRFALSDASLAPGAKMAAPWDSIGAHGKRPLVNHDGHPRHGGFGGFRGVISHTKDI